VKKLLLLFFMCCSIACLSQQTDRVVVAGKIFVPKNEEPEGIHIYNITSEKGTVTDVTGAFSMAVAEQDRLQITSIQYQSFTVVVSSKSITEGILKIYLNPFVNKLDEVLLSPYSLTGDLERDAQSIEVFATPKIELSFDADADFAPDRLSRVEGNAAQEALGYGRMQNGVNFVSIIAVLAKLILPKKKSKAPIPQFGNMISENRFVVLALQEKYTSTYYAENFGIPAEKVDDFIYFAKENAVTPAMLKPENEIELLETLFQQSELYKARINDE